jgi:hypothetical protein
MRFRNTVVGAASLLSTERLTAKVISVGGGSACLRWSPVQADRVH